MKPRSEGELGPRRSTDKYPHTPHANPYNNVDLLFLPGP